ncbi:MAG: hypothetical protein ACFFDT_14940 [Candidatus Hodarchaeota archaeon]
MVENIVLSTIIGKVITSLFGALKGNDSLKEYGKVLLKKARGDVVKYNHESLFWQDVIGPYFYDPTPSRKLSTGKAVELRNFYVSEWFPRCPGLIWTKEAQEYRERATLHKHPREFADEEIRKLGVYTPLGKTCMVLGGLGTTRLEKIEDLDSETTYRILGATSSGAYDQGVPLLVTEEVYDKVNEELTEEGTITANVTGFYSELPVDWKDTIIKVPGSEELSQKVREELSTTFHVPRHCLVVKSKHLISNVKKPKPDEETWATAWTLYKIGPPESEDSRSSYYSFTFAHFDPKDEENITQAANFLLEYIMNEYENARTNLKSEIYTDFDRKIARLKSLSSNIYFGKFIDRRFDSKESEKILKWAFSLENNDDFRIHL